MKFEGISQDDQDMNQAIEASLRDEDAIDMSQFDEKPLEERLRRGDRYACRQLDFIIPDV